MDAEQALRGFSISADSVVRHHGGRIQETYMVTSASDRYVLQRIGALFIPTMPDMERVTLHLKQRGMVTSEVLRTSRGELALADGAYAWRLMTYIPGRTLDHCASPEVASALGSYLGRFQVELAEFPLPFEYSLPKYRDTAHVLARLCTVTEQERDEMKRARCEPSFQRIQAMHTSLRDPSTVLSVRTSHGDPKVSNFRFEESETAVRALIDLDALGTYTVPIEVGDLLRSIMSNNNVVNEDLWLAAVDGYRKAAPFMTKEEWSFIPDGFRTFTLYLAARYLLDAHEETYFALDPVYPSLFEQNIARAEKNLSLLDSFSAHEAAIRNMHA